MYPKLATTKNSIDKQSDIVTSTMHMISTQTNRQVTISPYVTADALSRIELNQLGLSSPALIDYQAMAAAQGDDHFLTEESTHSALVLQHIPLQYSEGTVVCDMSTGVYPVVPPLLCHTVFKALHSL